MQRIIFLGILFSCCSLYGQNTFQLAGPLAKFESVFFKDSVRLELKFAQPGAKIYYRLDNKIPSENFEETTEKDLLYKKPLTLKNTFTTVHAKAFCSGFRPSETIEFSFAKQGRQIKKITSTQPNSKYPGAGDSTLFDNKGGMINTTSNTWMGFNSDTASFEVELTKEEHINTILLSFLQNEDSWIFLPELVLVYYFDKNKSSYLPFGREVIFHEGKSPVSIDFRFIHSKLDTIKTHKILIDLIPVKKIPDWHPAKGQHAWCFIDEIKVY